MSKILNLNTIEEKVMIQMDFCLINEDKIVETAKSLIGIPYEHNGRTKEGLDCWGLVYLFFQRLGCDLPRDDGQIVEKNWYKLDPDRYHRELNKLGEEVGHYKKLEKFDIPYFSLYKNVVTHSGVMLDKEHFIHVLNGRKVEISSFRKRLWRKKYKGGIKLNISSTLK